MQGALEALYAWMVKVMIPKAKNKVRLYQLSGIARCIVLQAMVLAC
jgi:hypothetical protein